MKKVLVKGNEAVALGAIEAGCQCYFAYPITPQNDIPEILSAKMPEIGACFLQAESEVGAINMLLGAAATGVRAMTSSSSPGISLMQEGISYLAGSELPAVIVNVQRSGPGLGGLHSAQLDYFQAVKCGGHGGYRLLVLAPASVSEMYHMTIKAFDLADKHRTPVIVLADAVLGNMKEALLLEAVPKKTIAKPWALDGQYPLENKRKKYIKSLHLGDEDMASFQKHLYDKFNSWVEEAEAEVDCSNNDKLVVSAYGSLSRVLKTAVQMAKNEGLKVGFIRPKTLYPFPAEAYKQATLNKTKVLVTEVSLGQMVEDVKLSVTNGTEVCFHPVFAGSTPSPEILLKEIKRLYPKK